MHSALEAMQRISDRGLWVLGFVCATNTGRLGSYMEMLNRGGSGGYSTRDICAAKMRPGFSPLPPQHQEQKAG